LWSIADGVVAGVVVADWLIGVAEPCSSIWETFQNNPVVAEPCLFSLHHSDYSLSCPVVQTCTELEMNLDQMANE
jgi:hypothetical protein